VYQLHLCIEQNLATADHRGSMLLQSDDIDAALYASLTVAILRWLVTDQDVSAVNDTHTARR